MDTGAIDRMLGQMRQIAAGAGQLQRPADAAGPAPDFANLLKHSLDGINQAQVGASRMARDFELGVADANLTDVMVSIQKANLSFQQVVQVRNRLVSAYHDIMNMQV